MSGPARALWLLPLVPLALGAVASALLATRPGGAPLLAVRMDLATLLALLGIALALLLAAILAVWAWGGRIRRASAATAAADRRRFLQRLDHELKNPLMAIRVATANLALAPSVAPSATMTGDPDEAGHRQIVGSIAAQATRLSRLAGDLRKLADLETIAIEREAIDLGALLGEVVALSGEGPGATARRLTLSLPRAPWPPPPVVGDRDLLFLALYNLLDNAIKFSAPGDTIEVRAFEDGARVVVEVADTGPGLPAEEIPFVWEELYRGQSARAVPGSGLGLPLVRAIVARHGGQIELRSRRGSGTVVTLRLPAEVAARPAPVTGR